VEGALWVREVSVGRWRTHLCWMESAISISTCSSPEGACH